MIVTTIGDLTDHIIDQGNGKKRCIVAIAGPPGVGKSTLSRNLLGGLKGAGHSAAIVQMDGFHLDNATLRSSGLLEKKGAPETFDASGFVELVSALRTNAGPVSVPEFDRDADRVRSDAASVSPDCTFVLVEGNYLLLDSAPWSDLQQLFDCRIMMSADLDELRERLISRWLTHGFNRHDAEAKALGNDIPNAEHVLMHSLPADIEYRAADITDQ